ncbi:MAG: integron integrase [Verrucomicrobiota bacterium]|nr:integron integrase [Verrucomicrobiota bacterium]
MDKVEKKAGFHPDPGLRLMEQVREGLRYYHYAYRTEQIYCEWIDRFVKFYRDERHPREMGSLEVERFLSHLASVEQVSASTQRQALNALEFLYDRVLLQPLAGEIAPIRARPGQRPPAVLTVAETGALLGAMKGTHGVMARLLYGAGLRLMECVRLRIRDVDFGQGLVYVRDGKGGGERTVPLPKRLKPALLEHLRRVRALHESDLAEGFGAVWLPEALSRKYPQAEREPGWQYVFPAKKRSLDPRSGREQRHHVMESGVQKAVKVAVARAGITKKVGCHTLRHSFATHLLESGVNIRVLQELMGHRNVKTTEMYTRVVLGNKQGITSPLDRL